MLFPTRPEATFYVDVHKVCIVNPMLAQRIEMPIETETFNGYDGCQYIGNQRKLLFELRQLYARSSIRSKPSNELDVWELLDLYARGLI